MAVSTSERDDFAVLRSEPVAKGIEGHAFNAVFEYQELVFKFYAFTGFVPANIAFEADHHARLQVSVKWIIRAGRMVWNIWKLTRHAQSMTNAVISAMPKLSIWFRTDAVLWAR